MVNAGVLALKDHAQALNHCSADLLCVGCLVRFRFTTVYSCLSSMAFDIANDYMTKGPSEVLSNGMRAIDLTAVAPRHEYHMRRLVELGAIAKIAFPMSNIANNSPARSMFLKRILAGDCPRCLYWSSTEYDDANPTVLDVWCELADREEWTLFLQRENELAGQKPEQRVADEALDQPF